MSEVLAVRDGDQVMRELAQTKAAVLDAQRVLIVGAGSIPRLLGELNASLADLGYMCVPIEPAQGLYKTFGDLLACPALAPLLQDQPAEPVPMVSAPAVAPVLALESTAVVLEPELSPPEPDPPAAPQLQLADVSALDMSRPINWKPGDVFISNPRVTLPHKCRKWLLDYLDVSDLENLSGMDVQLRSPNTTATELLTLKQFMAQYVFLERPAAEQSAAE